MARFKKPSPHLADLPSLPLPLARPRRHVLRFACVVVEFDDSVGVTGSIEMVCEHGRVARVVSV